MDFFSGTPQIEAGSESAEIVENFHRIRNSTTLIGPVPDRQTNIDATHHALIESFHQVGQQLAARRKGKGKGRGKLGKHLLDVPMYSGTDNTCTICTETMIQGERVVRLQCQHVFHELCWSDFVAADNRPGVHCCNCRLWMRTDEAIIAHYHYMPIQTATAQQPGADASDDDYGSAGSVSQQTLVTYGAFLLDPRVNGRLCMIVDIGAFINVFGSDLARQVALAGMRHGHQSSQTKLDRTLSIHGVGQGSQSCNWSVNMPAAVRIKTPPTASSTGGDEPEIAKLVRVESPVSEGTGSGLPGLLGLRTIERNNGVIETCNGQAFLTFPGPGGYRIEWAPGALHMPLTKAQSGHLCLELDHYDKIQQSSGGVPARERVLYSGQSAADSSSSTTTASRTVDAGTQTDPWLSAS